MKKLIVALFALCTTACTSTRVFYTSYMGEERIIGVSLPEQTSVNLSVYQTFEGNKVTVKDKANIWHRYSEFSTNSIFGVAKWTKHKESEIIICDTNQVLTVKR